MRNRDHGHAEKSTQPFADPEHKISGVACAAFVLIVFVCGALFAYAIYGLWKLPVREQRGNGFETVGVTEEEESGKHVDTDAEVCSKGASGDR